MNLFRFFNTLYLFIKYHLIINRTIQQEQLIKRLSEVMEAQFKCDWVNRIYAVINPQIANGQYNESLVFEYTEYGRDPSQWVYKFIMERLNILSEFINTKNLFEIFTYDIKDLGNHNYLVIIEPICYRPLKQYAKWASVELLVISVLIAFYLWFF